MSIQKKSLIGNLTAAKKAITAAIASAGAVEGRAKVAAGPQHRVAGAVPHRVAGAVPHRVAGAVPHRVVVK